MTGASAGDQGVPFRVRRHPAADRRSDPVQLQRRGLWRAPGGDPCSLVRHCLRIGRRTARSRGALQRGFRLRLRRGPAIDLPDGDAAASNFPTPQDFVGDTPGLMKSAIGQENVTATTLQWHWWRRGSLTTGSSGPHLLDKIIDAEGSLVETYHPHAWRRATRRPPRRPFASSCLALPRTRTGLHTVCSRPICSHPWPPRPELRRSIARLWNLHWPIAAAQRCGPDAHRRCGGDCPDPAGQFVRGLDRSAGCRAGGQSRDAKGIGDAAMSGPCPRPCARTRRGRRIGCPRRCPRPHPLFTTVGTS